MSGGYCSHRLLWASCGTPKSRRGREGEGEERERESGREGG